MISQQAQEAIDAMMAKRGQRFQSKEGLTFGEVARGIFEERRQGLEDAWHRPLPDGLALSLCYADGVPGEWLRVMSPDEGRLPNKAILFLHGGGFASGSAASRRHMAAKIALSAKIDLLSIDYRQCPEYSYPAHLDDCVSAFLWLLKDGYDPGDITVVGESAGATLALALAHYLIDHHFLAPGGVCAFSPVADMAAGYDSWITRASRDAMIGECIPEAEVEARLAEYRANGGAIRNGYCSAEEALSPYVSPVRGDFSRYPRLMIQAGSEERLYDDAVAVAEKAKAAGADVTLHIWEGLGHVFALFDCPETDAVCAEIGGFARNFNK